jgi:hypothetical protein
MATNREGTEIISKPNLTTPFIAESNNIIPSPGLNRDKPVKKLFSGMTALLYAGQNVFTYIPTPKGTGFPIKPGTKTDYLESEHQVPNQTIQNTTSYVDRKNQIHINFYDQVLQKKYVLSKNRGVYISLQYIPQEFETITSSMVRALNIVGANYQTYHYGGSEDSITFEARWHGAYNNEYFKTIQQKCRAVEALAKVDGWNGELPEIVLSWGYFNKFLANHVFVVEKVSTKFSQFMTSIVSNGERQGWDYQPLLAVQEISLRRVGDQLTYETMIY